MLVDIPYRLFVFDCDGTLVDSQHNIVAAMGAAWARHDLPAPLASDVRRIVGLTLEIAIARLLPAADDATHRTIAAAYREIVHDLRAGNAQGTAEEPLFPGIRELIEVLVAPEVFLGVATGKNLRGLEHTLAVHGLRDRFHTLQTADLCRSKPDPEMVLRAMAETGTKAATTVVIGDTSFDMEMARSAGATAIGVAWGYHEVAELRDAGAHAIIDHPAELLVELRRLAPAA
ncbi:MAG TPA: HAD-IA family hydrolase [Dongiaceae bacterium]|jgi:phosphoglycolate phosphatase|nr:HAD-IA family hydrolase [Dongiaceae bacterium]